MLAPSLTRPELWPDADKRELLARRSRAGRRSFVQFVDQVTRGGYRWYREDSHVRKLARVLQDVADGRRQRVMVFMPPRHGKSHMVSRLFSAYYLTLYPDRWVGLTSYGATLAYTLSRNARAFFQLGGGALSGEAAAVQSWETTSGGGLWAAGVGGGITGKGFNLGIIDDPIKDAQEAQSTVVQLRNEDWFDSTFFTRAMPNSAIIVIQTRWHERDLAGYLLDKEAEESQGWHIVKFAALKDVDEDFGPTPPAWTKTCTFEPDGRALGEALCPDLFDEERLTSIKRTVGPYTFGALYQQMPRPREGNMFKREWFDIVDGFPTTGSVNMVRYWDKAGTQDDGDFTAGVLLAESGGVYYVADLVMGQWAAAERERVIKQTAVLDEAQWGSVARIRIVVEQEGGSGGKESAENTVRNLAGHDVRVDRPVGDKVARADPVAAQAGIRNVKLVKGSWNRRFLDILTAFPTGSIKDPVDALSGAFAQLAGKRKSKSGVRRYA